MIITEALDFVESEDMREVLTSRELPSMKEYFKVEALSNAKPCNNPPEKAAKYNNTGKAEQIIEKKLTYSQGGRQHLMHILECATATHLENIFNQLPNGLFDSEIVESNRVFTSGACDIWGLDADGYFCIFELKKKDNKPLGILSELFFYAAYAHEVLLNEKRLHDATEDYRGYGLLYDAVQKGVIKGIKAFFLLGSDAHRYIEEYKSELLAELDKNSFHIKFYFIKYDMNIIDGIDDSEIITEV